MPRLPVSIAAASDRMSPKMLPVTSVSKLRGLRTSCMAALSTYLRAPRRLPRSRPARWRRSAATPGPCSLGRRRARRTCGSARRPGRRRRRASPPPATAWTPQVRWPCPRSSGAARACAPAGRRHARSVLPAGVGCGWRGAAARGGRRAPGASARGAHLGLRVDHGVEAHARTRVVIPEALWRARPQSRRAPACPALAAGRHSEKGAAAGRRAAGAPAADQSRCRRPARARS